MSAKELELRPVPARTANAFIRKTHYSGKVVRNSQTHIGVFWHGALHGAMQLGPPLDRSKLLPLVDGTRRENMAELNRLAFDETLPRNSESRAIAVMRRLLRKHRPELKWLVSFADATSCGDGTIYRASGMILTGIKPNLSLLEMPDGRRFHEMTLRSSPTKPIPWLGGQTFYEIAGGKHSMKAFREATGAKPIEGFQLRYVMFLDPSWRSRLTVPEIPYEQIDVAGATMYRGKRAGSIDGDAPSDQAGPGRFDSDPGAPNLMDTPDLMDTR